jgi:tetratricopeptide (TPR) repeat protein
VNDQEIAAPASRNSPCPCGSGKRYKDCHGAISALPVAPDDGAERTQRVAIARSRYRAPGTEWTHLQQDKQDALGVLMEEALGFQQGGRMARAAALYREVLLAAPDTHDALHMLGVIEYGLRNFDVALELIVRASRLRPTYEAIETNLALVRASLSGQKHSFNEQLAERALPALCELINSRAGRAEPRAQKRSGAQGLHLIGRAHAIAEDDAWTLSRLVEVLAPLRPTVWVADADSPLSEAPKGWNVLDHRIGSYPRSGTHVFVGIDFRIGEWVRHANPHRVVVVCNRGSPSTYIRQLRAMSLDGLRVIEPVFMSRSRSERFGQGHRTIPVPKIDFCQSARVNSTDRRSASKSKCVVGLIGQTSDRVEEPEDAQDLAHIAAVARSLAVYDPGRYRFFLGASALISFTERWERTLEEFIASVDCLYWRPAPWWDEGVGREILTAMELGKPVICPRTSLHSDIFDHRVDGLLFDTQEELLALLDELRASPSLAQEIADAARAKARQLVIEASELARYGALTGAHVNTLAGVSNAY